MAEIQFLVFAVLGYTSDLLVENEDQCRGLKASPVKDSSSCFTSTGIGKYGRTVTMSNLQVQAGVLVGV